MHARTHARTLNAPSSRPPPPPAQLQDRADAERKRSQAEQQARGFAIKRQLPSIQQQQAACSIAGAGDATSQEPGRAARAREQAIELHPTNNSRLHFGVGSGITARGGLLFDVPRHQPQRSHKSQMCRSVSSAQLMARDLNNSITSRHHRTHATLRVRRRGSRGSGVPQKKSSWNLRRLLQVAHKFSKRCRMIKTAPLILAQDVVDLLHINAAIVAQLRGMVRHVVHRPPLRRQPLLHQLKICRERRRETTNDTRARADWGEENIAKWQTRAWPAVKVHGAQSRALSR